MSSENIPDKNTDQVFCSYPVLENSLTQGGVVFAGEGGQIPEKGTETW